jgi:hypothetical protein
LKNLGTFTSAEPIGAGVNASFAIAAAEAAPAVSIGGQVDGAENAPSGRPQFAGLLRGYSARPPWRVAGVDYYVGLPADIQLKDPLTTSAKGLAIDMANHLIRVTENKVVLDGYDFSLHGGYGVYILPGIRDTVVTRSKFLVGANNVVPIAAEAGAGSLTVSYNTIDGGSHAANGNSDSAWALINFNGSGTFVAKYNVLTNAPFDAIDFNNGTIEPTIEYNLVTNLGHSAGSHPDFVQFVGSAATNSVIAFNTIYQPMGGGEVSGMEGIQIVAQTGAHASSIVGTTVANNTIIATGPDLTMSCSIAIQEEMGNVIDVVHVRDNYLDFRGAYYAFYPMTGSRVTFEGNIDMATGQRIPAPLTLKPKRPVQ